MSKYSALGLARSMSKGKDLRVLSLKQTQFLRDICDKEYKAVQRQREKKEYQKSPDRRRFPVVPGSGSPVWKDGDSYIINGEGEEAFCVAKPFFNGCSQLVRKGEGSDQWFVA